MKRPRRPVKKRKVASKKAQPRKSRKPSKAFRKIEAGLKQALSHARGGMSAEDAAIFDIPKPPAGLAYQWSSLASTERMLMKGWARVPYSRHPELPRSLSFDGSILYCDNVLFQIGADFVEALKQSGYKRAIAQRQGVGAEAIELMAAYSDPGSLHRRSEGREFPLVSPSFIVSSSYARPSTSGDVVIDLVVKFSMPYRWRDAAAALQLDESEYVRRRLAQGARLCVAADGTYFASEPTEEG